MTSPQAIFRQTNRRPPSRDDNPFATCWTRPGALPFLPTSSVSVEQLVEAWLAGGQRGQVVGPHGVGKSTLLAAAGDVLAAQGWTVEQRVFRSDGRSHESDACDNSSSNTQTILLIDGLEQLGWWRQRRLLRYCRRKSAGMLASTHHATPGLPVLARLAPSLPLVLELHGLLTRDRLSPVTQQMAAATFQQTGGDIRELWFRLYDLHEQLTRCHA